MTEKENTCIKLLVSNAEVVNGISTCFYDNRSGFLTVSFNKLSLSSSLKALLTLMEEFSWQIVGIKDDSEYGQYAFNHDLLDKLKTLEKHPLYNNNWGYALYKCTRHVKELYNVREVSVLNTFISNMLGSERNKFNSNWEIKYSTYLSDSVLQGNIDRCLYMSTFNMISSKLRGKQLSLGLSDGVFKLYESDGIGN